MRALPLLLALAGCGTAVEMREQPADLTTYMPGSFDTVARCVANESDALPTGFGFSPSILRLDEARKTAHLYRTTQSGSAVWDVTFTQDAGRVRIEGRGTPTIYGRTRHLQPVWDLLPRC